MVLSVAVDRAARAGPIHAANAYFFVAVVVSDAVLLAWFGSGVAGVAPDAVLFALAVVTMLPPFELSVILRATLSRAVPPAARSPSAHVIVPVVFPEAG